jgi:hypothetical protein
MCTVIAVKRDRNETDVKQKQNTFILFFSHRELMGSKRTAQMLDMSSPKLEKYDSLKYPQNKKCNSTDGEILSHEVGYSCLHRT